MFEDPEKRLYAIQAEVQARLRQIDRQQNEINDLLDEAEDIVVDLMEGEDD